MNSENSVSAQDFLDFLKRILQKPQQRRYLLQQWHSVKKKEAERLADIFEQFINIILFHPIRFHLLADRFYLFQGTELPISYEWVSEEDQRFLIKVMQNRTKLYKKRNEYMNHQFDYSEFVYENDSCLPMVWRQQIVRDFVWMVAKKNDRFFTSELISAVQWIRILRKDKDLFLKNIHSGLQKLCHLEEVLCLG